jgi:mRNA-degrading endonuclease RelE of RelBE toxin-antitoxin system
MPDEDLSPPVAVRFTPEFKRNLRALSRKYRHIRCDLQPVLEQIQFGSLVGNRIAGTGYTVLKVRVRNSDVRRGKSGGYRLIYLLKSPTDAVLITIYSKSEQSDITAGEIRRIVTEAESRR